MNNMAIKGISTLPEVYQHCHAIARYYCLSGARVAALLGFPRWQKPVGSASTQLALERSEVGVSQHLGPWVGGCADVSTHVI